MVVPARPLAGAVLESAWGQVVHDTAVALDIQSGRATVVFASAAFSSSVTVTFPRPFAAGSTPVVVATVGGPTTSGVNVNVGVASVVAASCAVQAREVRDTVLNVSMEVEWIAIGPRA